MQGVASMGYAGGFTAGDRFFVPLFNGRFLGVVSLYYLLTGDPLWRRVGEGIVNGFRRMVVYRDDYAFFQTMLYGPETQGEYRGFGAARRSGWQSGSLGHP